MCLYYPSFSNLKLMWSVDFMKNICMIAIDEAHCISQWGNGFRKAFGELMAQRRIGRFMLTNFMKSSTRWTCWERVWLSNDWQIFSIRCHSEEMDAVLSLGFEDECSGGMYSWIGIGECVAYWSLLKCVCHVLETYTRTTETHQTLWVQQNHCFSISDPHSAGVTQRGWISRLMMCQFISGAGPKGLQRSTHPHRLHNSTSQELPAS